MSTLALKERKFRLDDYNFERKRNRKGPRKILVVEDEEESKLLIETTLRAVVPNATLKWVKKAEEAEEILRSNDTFDLIIADHFLEGLETGLDLWKSLRIQHKKIPFIMTSSISEKTFSTPPLFLQKPFLPRDCKNMIQWCLDEGGENFSQIRLMSEQQWADAQLFAASVFTLLLALLVAFHVI